MSTQESIDLPVSYTKFEVGDFVRSNQEQTDGAQLDSEHVYVVKEFFPPTKDNHTARVLLEGRHSAVSVNSLVDAYADTLNTIVNQDLRNFYQAQIDDLNAQSANPKPRRAIDPQDLAYFKQSLKEAQSPETEGEITTGDFEIYQAIIRALEVLVTIKKDASDTVHIQFYYREDAEKNESKFLQAFLVQHKDELQRAVEAYEHPRQY